MAAKTKKRPAVTAAMKRTIDAIGDNWIFRASISGVGHGGFKWAAVGVWTKCPDWNPEPVCGGGLHGQGPGGFGYAHDVENARFEFCQTKGERVVVDGNKVKVEHARILWIGADAFLALLYATKRKFPGSLGLSGCDLKGITLPTSVGGSLVLSGAKNIPESLPTMKVIR